MLIRFIDSTNDADTNITNNGRYGWVRGSDYYCLNLTKPFAFLSALHSAQYYCYYVKARRERENRRRNWLPVKEEEREIDEGRLRIKIYKFVCCCCWFPSHRTVAADSHRSSNKRHSSTQTHTWLVFPPSGLELSQRRRREPFWRFTFDALTRACLLGKQNRDDFIIQRRRSKKNQHHVNGWCYFWFWL